MAKRAGVVKRSPGKLTFAKFEKSEKSEPKGMKEGSAKEERYDRAQFAKAKKGK